MKTINLHNVFSELVKLIEPAKLSQRILALCAAWACGGVLCASANTLLVFGTGVDGSGNVLPGGSVDPHYSFADLGSPGIVYSASSQWYQWLPNDAQSGWIGFKDSGDTQPYATHDIETTFDLAGYDSATATLAGSWVADQNGSLYLNGQLVQTVADGNWDWTDGNNPTSFNITSGFLPGVNTLDFQVTFPDGFDGLRVEPMTLTANPIPEDGHLGAMLLSMGLLGVGWLRRKFVKH